MVHLGSLMFVVEGDLIHSMHLDNKFEFIRTSFNILELLNFGFVYNLERDGQIL